MDSLTVQNKKYWCFDCKTDSNNITPKFSCSKCDSLAIEEITLQNDPRKYQIPVIQNNQQEDEQELENGIGLQVLTIQGDNISITIIGGIQRLDGNTGEEGINILRMLRTMMAQGNEETPATEYQIQSLQNISHVQCSVCQEDGGSGLKLDCGHSFHKDCILPWFQRKNTCPCCRKQLSSQ